MLAAFAAVLLSQVTPNIPAPIVLPNFPPSEKSINIVNWSGNSLPKIYQRSEQLPVTDEDLMKLSKEGFDADDLVKMIEERRCNCDASADGLIKMKRAGVDKKVLAAVSLHGLKPNREFNLLMLFDFVGDSREARKGTLYAFIDDGPRTRVFTVNIGDVLKNRWATETMVDKSDVLITRQVRRVEFVGQVPLKVYGKHHVLVVASANPSYTHPSQLTDAERAAAQTYTFDYPRTSLSNLCRLTAGYKRDAVLAYQWNYVGSRFECEWE